MKKRRLFMMCLLSLAMTFSAFVAFDGVSAAPVEEFTIDGDILVDGDSGSAAIKEVAAGAEVKYEATLDVRPIKDKMRAVETQFNLLEALLEQIELKNTKSEFKAILTVKKSEIDLASAAATLVENDLFELKPENVTKKDVDGDTVALELVMTLKKDYAKYVDLKKDVLSSPDTFKVVTTGIKVKDAVADGTLVKASGDVSGTFSSTSKLNAVETPFDFMWKGVQLKGGEDASQGAGIAYTVKVKNAKSNADDKGATTPAKQDDAGVKPSNKTATKNVVKTADERDLTAAMLGMAFSALALTTLIVKRKNEK